MSLWRMAWRYLWRQPLVTSLTILGLSLGCGLISGVLTLRQESEKSFLHESALYDMVIGAKGSPLQLVLNSVYHLDTPNGNISYEEYLRVKDDFRVKRAIPLGLGDNYRGFRIVGTTSEYLGLERLHPETEKIVRLFSLDQGEIFSKPFDVVLGAAVAQQTGLNLGDTFSGTHGIIETEGAEVHAEFPYTVVGILKPSGTSADRIILTPLKSVWIVHAKEEELHAKIFDKPVENKLEVTSILVDLTTPAMRYMMLDTINQTTNAMGAIPVTEMLRLYRKILGPMEKTLLMVAYLVVIVSALSIITSLYQAADRRRRDIAVMRAMGAHQNEIMRIVFFEAFFLTTLGLLLGWTLGHMVLDIGFRFFGSDMGLSIAAWSMSIVEMKIYGMIAAIAISAGVAPGALHFKRSPVKDL